jgi:flagellar biogenesis protein FliO
VAPELAERESPALQRRDDPPASPVVAGRSAQSSYSMARTLGALAGVVGLIVLLAWGYRAMTGGRLNLLSKPRRPGLIELVSKTSLSARQSLCLVRVGPRLVLIGQSPENLRTLDVIDDADLAARLIGEAAGQRAGSSQAEFQDCLEREAMGYRHDTIAVNETIPPEGRRLADVQQGLTDTIQRIRRVAAQA